MFEVVGKAKGQDRNIVVSFDTVEKRVVVAQSLEAGKQQVFIKNSSGYLDDKEEVIKLANHLLEAAKKL